MKALRARLGLAQREMALVLGVDITAVQRWEQGDRAVAGPVARLLLALERSPALVLLLRAVA